MYKFHSRLFSKVAFLESWRELYSGFLLIELVGNLKKKQMKLGKCWLYKIFYIWLKGCCNKCSALEFFLTFTFAKEVSLTFLETKIKAVLIQKKVLEFSEIKKLKNKAEIGNSEITKNVSIVPTPNLSRFVFCKNLHDFQCFEKLSILKFLELAKTVPHICAY